MNLRQLAIASVIAGFLMGLFSNLPVIYLFNCLGCGWVWSLSVFAAWLYQRGSGTQPAITTGQGVVVGVATAIVGVIVFGIFYFLLSPILFGYMAGDTAESQAVFWGFTGVTGLAYIGIAAVLFPIFGAAGGALGAILFNRKTAVTM